MAKSYKYKYLVIIGAAICSAAMLWGQDDNQAELRENPEMDSDKNINYALPKIEYPQYINLDANHINMNNDDWSDLVAHIDLSNNQLVNIVHIGDSHLQADMATAVTRLRLGEHYGSGGRALVTPFKLAGTNEPVDYSITTDVSLLQSRLLKLPWQTAMGFTGIGIRPLKETFNINISTKEPFDSIAIYYSGDSLYVLNDCTMDLKSGIASIALSDTCSNISLQMKSRGRVDIHGFNLVHGKSGIAYHVIGNNGATFFHYNGIRNFARDISSFDPSLIIISLGTNEAFGRTSDEEMMTQMKTMISTLKTQCPNACFLLTTPSECQRRTYRGSGRRRRRTGYAVNTNVKRLRNVILEFANKENIPVYDFYAIAGGDGSSTKWLNDGKMNKDRVHLLRPGYTLQGNLFTDALEEAFQKFRNNNTSNL